MVQKIGSVPPARRKIAKCTRLNLFLKCDSFIVAPFVRYSSFIFYFTQLETNTGLTVWRSAAVHLTTKATAAAATHTHTRARVLRFERAKKKKKQGKTRAQRWGFEVSTA